MARCYVELEWEERDGVTHLIGVEGTIHGETVEFLEAKNLHRPHADCYSCCGTGKVIGFGRHDRTRCPCTGPDLSIDDLPDSFLDRAAEELLATAYDSAGAA